MTSPIQLVGFSVQDRPKIFHPRLKPKQMKSSPFHALKLYKKRFLDDNILGLDQNLDKIDQLIVSKQFERVDRQSSFSRNTVQFPKKQERIKIIHQKNQKQIETEKTFAFQKRNVSPQKPLPDKPQKLLIMRNTSNQPNFPFNLNYLISVIRKSAASTTPKYIKRNSHIYLNQSFESNQLYKNKQKLRTKINLPQERLERRAESFSLIL